MIHQFIRKALRRSSSGSMKGRGSLAIERPKEVQRNKNILIAGLSPISSMGLKIAESPMIIVGAGVLGLSTATKLQDAFPGRPICIVAAETPTTSSPTASYASMWAGAHYRPIPAGSSQLKREMELAWQTNEIMKGIAKASPESGVQVMQGVEYLEKPPPENLALKTGDVMAGIRDGFRVLAKNELPEGVTWGCVYQAYCVNVAIYCSWLLKNFQARGGKVIQRTLKCAEDAFAIVEREGLEEVKFVANCSGDNFGLDSKMRVIRGQTVLVKNFYHKTVTRQMADGTWAFLIPRPRGGGTIVGGSKEIGDMEEEPRPETTAKLLQNSIRYFPEFVSRMEEFEIHKNNVGRRPWREGGLRMEAEDLPGGRCIIHGYGAGGRGYELSWGVAEKLVQLVRDTTRQAAKL
jgi:D-amino-acid oxidase